MLTFILELLGMLLVILVAAELFTNALEHFGERLGISEGVTGSLFAAVGTALPETLIPLLALFAGTSNITLNEDVVLGHFYITLDQLAYTRAAGSFSAGVRGIVALVQ